MIVMMLTHVGLLAVYFGALVEACRRVRVVCGVVGAATAVVRVHHNGRRAAERVEHHGPLVHRVGYFADQTRVLDQKLHHDPLLVYVQVVDFVDARVDDVGRKANGQIERVHLVEGLLLRHLLEKVHEIDEYVQVDVGQLQTQVEYGLELGLGGLQLDGLYEVGVERKGEQRLGQLAEKEFNERGEVEDGELAEVVRALFHLLFELFEARGRAVASEYALDVNELVYVIDGILKEANKEEKNEGGFPKKVSSLNFFFFN